MHDASIDLSKATMHFLIAYDEYHKGYEPFMFAVVYSNMEESYRAYVLLKPDLKGRVGSGTITHLNKDIRLQLPYICVVEKIATQKKMLTVAKFWAKKYIRYISTGKTFDE